MPKVGVSVIIINDKNQILLGMRKGSHGAGTWAFPGGHLEFGESVENCAIREVLEETGLNLKEVQKGPFTNDIFHSESKHYITLYVICRNFEGILQAMEPDKCDSWGWFNLDKLPSPLFLPLQNLVSQDLLAQIF